MVHCLSVLIHRFLTLMSILFWTSCVVHCLSTFIIGCVISQIAVTIRLQRMLATDGVVRRWPIRFLPYLRTGFCMYFFNRRYKMNHLLSGMKDIYIPDLNVVTGPINSGKTTLVEKLAKKLSDLHVPLLYINISKHFSIHLT